MTTTTALVILEGQQHHIPTNIASDDSLLLSLFAMVNPALANAEIKRNGTSIELIARKGTKGNTQAQLKVLDLAHPEIDPAVLICHTLLKHESTVGIEAEKAELIVEQTNQALVESREQEKKRRETIKALDRATPESIVVIGF